MNKEYENMNSTTRKRLTEAADRARERVSKLSQSEREELLRGAFETIRNAPSIPDGVACSHPGCLSHVSHPCDGCGRIGGRRKAS